MAVSYTFQSSNGSSADASSYNFTVDLGTAAADRKILAGVFSNAGTGADPTSVTINGVTATKLAGASGSIQGSNYSWWIADVPTGTTGVTIAVSWGSARSRAGVAVWPIYGAGTVTLDAVSSGPANPANINIAADRYVFAMSHIRHSAQYYFGIGDDYFSSASLGHSITADVTGFTGITYRTRQAVDSGGTVNQLESYAISLNIAAPVVAIEKDFDFDYAIPVVVDYDFDYLIEADALRKSFAFEYEIKGPISADFDFDYSIYLNKRFAFRYKISMEYGLFPYLDNFDNGVHPHASPVEYPLETATDYSETLIGGTTPKVTPEHVVKGDAGGFLVSYFYDDYYERIWLDPQVVALTNVRLGVPLPFGVWNAYSVGNSIEDATLNDLQGVGLTFEMPLPLARYEYRKLYFYVDDTAPPTLRGWIDFDWTYGTARLDIIATIVVMLQNVPEIPVNEKWTWYTALTKSDDGTEQRVQWRDQPRVKIEATIVITDPAEHQRLWRHVYNTIDRDFQAPMYHYATFLTADADVDDTRLFFDPAATNLREGDYAALFNPKTEATQLVRVVELLSDGCNIEFGIEQAVTRNWSIMPTIKTRPPAASGLAMAATSGSYTMRLESVQRWPVKRPGASVALTMFDGYPVLTDRSLVKDTITDNFDKNVEWTDNLVALPIPNVSWKMPQITSQREYKAMRPEGMDYWREFFDYCKGQQKPFLVATWRNDISLVEPPSLGDLQIRSDNVDYADYWQHETFKRIQIETANGIEYRRVVAVDGLETGTLTLTLDAPLGTNEGDADVLNISYLNLVRLASDAVELEHYFRETYITIGIKTVNE